MSRFGVLTVIICAGAASAQVVLNNGADIDMSGSPGSKIIFPDGTTMSSGSQNSGEPFSSVTTATNSTPTPLPLAPDTGTVPSGKELVVQQVRVCSTGFGVEYAETDAVVLQARPPAPNQNDSVIDLAVLQASAQDFPDGRVVVPAGYQPWLENPIGSTWGGYNAVVSIHGYIRDQTTPVNETFDAVRYGGPLADDLPLDFPAGPNPVPMGKELVILQINIGSGLTGPSFPIVIVQSRLPFPDQDVEVTPLTSRDSRTPIVPSFPEGSVIVPEGHQCWLAIPDFDMSDYSTTPYAISVHGYYRDAPASKSSSTASARR